MSFVIQRFESGLVLMRFPALWLHPYVRPTAPGSRTYERVRGAEAMAAVPDALAALDGSMYDDLGGGRADLNYLVSGTGINDPGDFDARGITLNVLASGQTSWVRGGTIIAGARTSVQFYPSLIERGVNVQNPARDTDSNWRAAIVEFSPGELALAVQRAPMHAFTNNLIAAGAQWAGYTDGGGSARALARLADGSLQRFGSTEDRAVPMWLMVRPSALPPTSSSTTTTLLLLMIAMVVAFGAWTNYRRYSRAFGMFGARA
jgi:hypothetical protein